MKSRPRCRIHRLAGLIVAAISLAAAAQAQQQPVNQLPDSIVRSASIAGVERSQIETYVTVQVGGLFSRDRAVLERARDRLIEPLGRDGVTVAFRLAYAAALTPRLTELGSDGSFQSLDSLLLIAGELATSGMVDVIKPYLDNSSAPVRYRAAYSMGRLFEAVQSRSAAIRPDEINRAIALLAERTRVEPDLHVMDRDLRSLLSATRIIRSDLGDVRSTAFVALCDSASARIRGDPPEQQLDQFSLSALEVGLMIRDTLIAHHQNPVSRDALVRAGGVGGDLVAFVHRHLADQAASDEQPRAWRILRVADAIISLAASNLTGRDVPSPDSALAFQNGAQAFDQTCEQIFGPAGLLTSDPFAFKPDRFHK